MKLNIVNSFLEAKPYRKTFDGIETLVVPVIALQESVLNDIYYHKNEINNFPEMWNGVPVTVNHPEIDGKHVSANNPLMEETLNIGRLFNVKVENDQLKGEIWLNVEKARRLGYEGIIEHFDDNKMMEVSTGFFGELIEEENQFRGKKYKARVKNIYPDHLALLLSEKGACSLSDGCGALRVQKQCKCELPDSRSHNNINNYNGGLIMKEKIITSLISNDSTLFESGDRGELEQLSENVLNKCLALLNNMMNFEDKHLIEKLKTNCLSDEERVLFEELKTNRLSDEESSLFQHLKLREESRISELKETIVSNYQHLTLEMIDNMKTEALEALSKTVDSTFVPSAGNASKERQYLPKGVFFKRELSNG